MRTRFSACRKTYLGAPGAPRHSLHLNGQELAWAACEVTKANVYSAATQRVHLLCLTSEIAEHHPRDFARLYLCQEIAMSLFK